MTNSSKYRVAIVAGGQPPCYEWLSQELSSCDFSIAADSGAYAILKAHQTPDLIVGDLDSFNLALIQDLELQEKLKNRLHLDPDQNLSDLEVALDLLLKELHTSFSKASLSVTLYATQGKRFDHSFSNLLSLLNYSQSYDIDLCIKDPEQTLFIIHKSTSFICQKGQTVSVFPLTTTKHLSFQGLLYPVNDKETCLGWQGLSNVATSDCFTISLSSGSLLVCLTNHFKPQD